MAMQFLKLVHSTARWVPATLTIFMILALLPVISNAQDRPYAYGPLTAGELFADYSRFQERAEKVAPDQADVEKLAGLKDSVHVKIFLATWCPDSRKHVPTMLRLMDAKEFPLFTREIVGVDYDKKDPEGRSGEHNITHVPTFIVYHEGEEIGRIIEHPEHSIARDFLGILEEANLLK